MEAIHAPLGRLNSSVLRTTSFDKVAALLIALLIMAAAAVTGMFIVWLTATLVFKRHDSHPEKWTEIIAGRNDHEPGFETSLEAPGMEEMPELAEPQMEAVVQAITNAVSDVAAIDVSPNTGNGNSGPGAKRPPGPPQDGPNIVPRWDRWEIRFESSSMTTYARQLDYFKIELGAAGGGKPHVDYAYNLTQARPDTKSGPGSDEKRLFMTWRAGTLQQFDRQLLGRAGIETRRRVAMQFYPEAVENELAEIEKANADKQGKTLPEYLKTVFAVEGSENDWKFTVVEQRFRAKPK